MPRGSVLHHHDVRRPPSSVLHEAGMHASLHHVSRRRAGPVVSCIIITPRAGILAACFSIRHAGHVGYCFKDACRPHGHIHHHHETRRPCDSMLSGCRQPSMHIASVGYTSSPTTSTIGTWLASLLGVLVC